MAFSLKPDFKYRGVGVVFSIDDQKEVACCYALIYKGRGPDTSSPIIDGIRRRIEANPLAYVALINRTRARETLIKLAIDAVLPRGDKHARTIRS